MGAIEETSKRMEIVQDIVSQIKDFVKGVIVGGSMGYGYNFSVNPQSDIDLVIIIDKGMLTSFLCANFFKGNISQEVVDAFSGNIINMFWVVKQVNEVPINIFVYESDNYKDFCLLKGKFTGFIPFKPGDIQTSYRFDGSKISFDRAVRPFSNGFLLDKPSLAGGVFWGGPPRNDLLMMGKIVHEKDSFVSDLSAEVWKAVINQMIKEYGKDIDLSKVNVINSDFTYQNSKERIPIGLINKVNDRTKEELASYF